ncbi:MAG: hypothetical protein JO199_05960 [Candidatus Eremiobacteraeota bacterium]|nr:hypothetical protein [Candidatus Eremiobacteraeota bacterium]
MSFRYFLISAAIVFGGTIAVAAWVNRDLIRIKIASVNVPVPPKPGRLQTVAPGTPRPLSISAPWILSALPGCLRQESDTTGPSAYTLAHLPAGAVPVASPVWLTYGDCTIIVGRDEAWVRRGPDRFYVPPHVRFFRAGQQLAVLRQDGPGTDLRVYDPAPQ